MARCPFTFAHPRTSCSMPGMDVTLTCLPYVRIPSVLYFLMLYEMNNTDRGILTALIFYCAMNRNGGRIPNCRNWSRIEWARAGISSNIWTKSVQDFSNLAEDLQKKCKGFAAREHNGDTVEAQSEQGSDMDVTRSEQGSDADGTQQTHGRNTDRTWMLHTRPLLAWDGNDLLVLAYPADDERKANSHALSRSSAPSLAPAGAPRHAPAQEENRTEGEIERERE